VLEKRRAAVTSTPTATPTPEAPSEDDARLEQAVLGLDDLPDGWTGDQRESDIVACQPIVNARTRATGTAISPALGDDTGAMAQSWVYLYDDETVAEQTYVDLVRDDTRACIAETLLKTFPDDLGVTYEAQPSSQDPLAVDNDGGRMMITLKPEAVVSRLFLDIRFGLSGRGVAMMLFVAPEEPFDGDLRLDLVDALAERFKAALPR
jgi:hypothetical protein